MPSIIIPEKINQGRDRRRSPVLHLWTEILGCCRIQLVPCAMLLFLISSHLKLLMVTIMLVTLTRIFSCWSLQIVLLCYNYITGNSECFLENKTRVYHRICIFDLMMQCFVVHMFMKNHINEQSNQSHQIGIHEYAI